MVTPLVKVKSLKKHSKPFKRHQSDRKIAVKVRRPPKREAGPASRSELPSDQQGCRRDDCRTEQHWARRWARDRR